jgi:hypothetical protein
MTDKEWSDLCETVDKARKDLDEASPDTFTKIVQLGEVFNSPPPSEKD